MATHFFGSEFFSGEFFFSSATTQGGHFGGRHKEREFHHEREAKRRLRRQILEAMDGPHAEVVEEVLSEYIEDKPFLPIEKRIQWDRIENQMQIIEYQILMHLAWAEDDDDEDVLLLNG